MAKPVKKQRWGQIDAFGLLNGISTWDPQYRTLRYVRRPYEDTLAVRDKIMRQHDYPGGVTKQGILNGLSNEFGYTPQNVIRRNIFGLTYDPVPSGAPFVQDIRVEFRERGAVASGAWTELFPQVWNQDYASAVEAGNGFIVWQNEKYTNLSGYKNFLYSPILEIIEDLPDNQEIRVSYYVRQINDTGESELIRYTDMDDLDDPNDTRFLYRDKEEIEPLSGVIVYNLGDIPANLSGQYYESNGLPKELLYTIRDHIDKKFQHRWGQMTDASVIWDVHKGYGSGQIPHFLDAAVPKNENWCYGLMANSGLLFSGYQGGVDELSNALYFNEIVEASGDIQRWYFKVYPGEFYVDGIPYYLFENPQTTNVTLSGGITVIPSGLNRGMKAILAVSGYYGNGCTEQDPYLSGLVYEDHWYPTGENGDSIWSNIYRRRPHLTASMGYDLPLQLGEYALDFGSGLIRANVLESGAILIWDQIDTPSGRLIEYDINPLNDEMLNIQKFFLYLANKKE